MLNWLIEQELLTKGYKVICGVDEAGRGPLAGPVVAAAVILPYGADIPGLDDSKKISEKKRGKLFEVITKTAAAYAIASASHIEIDTVNILEATYLAMNRSIEMLEAIPDISIIDGNRNSGIKYPSKCIVGGDGISPSIAAASILAKVTRDKYMTGISDKYPQYAFEKHKGYGTKLHYERLRQYGPSEIHRKSFLKSFFKETSEIGKWGEQKALEYLEGKGYTVVSKGFRSRFGEIDIILTNKEHIVFAEVKTRKNADFAYARESVNYAKQKKIIATAQYYMTKHTVGLQPRFDVVEIYAKNGTETASPEIEHIENAFGVS